MFFDEFKKKMFKYWSFLHFGFLINKEKILDKVG